ncbi:MAG: tRNA (N6-isopentenyl adenosine(37)-C2)-methylthiotransferase MiaB [Rectinemataceae bacterium]|nr:tRNA (N6-isopentenyl adenosine(37)-C2)-methylthiotransferase MiaB [Rectinemataceae bacterium]
MTYCIETYGCQMNKAESSALETMFRERGWTVCAIPEESDLVLINTCSVRATAETRAWGRIDHFAAIKRQRKLTLVVTGCMAERMRTSVHERQKAIDYVVGTFQKQSFGLILDAVAQGRKLEVLEESPSFVFSSSHHDPGAFRAFVPIMHGCDNFCSYCIVPYLRGRETSRNPASILAELDSLEDSGVREVTLLGQNVNSYRFCENGAILDFPSLMRRIASHLRSRGVDGIRWIRFLTSHPKDLSAELIEVMAEEPVFCRHIHLCVQSGSDAVLAAMNRKYTREHYFGLVDAMKARIPGLTLSTDILVGFPGETDADLESTLDLMRKVGYVYSYMYHFNPREGTPAVKMENRVPDRVKKERLSRVIAFQKEMTGELMRSRLGQIDEVLIEDVSKKRKNEVLARTRRDEMVVFPAAAARIGTFAHVRLVSLSGNTFRAEETGSTAGTGITGGTDETGRVDGTDGV